MTPVLYRYGCCCCFCSRLCAVDLPEIEIFSSSFIPSFPCVLLYNDKMYPVNNSCWVFLVWVGCSMTRRAQSPQTTAAGYSWSGFVPCDKSDPITVDVALPLAPSLPPTLSARCVASRRSTPSRSLAQIFQLREVLHVTDRQVRKRHFASDTSRDVGLFKSGSLEFCFGVMPPGVRWGGGGGR